MKRLYNSVHFFLIAWQRRGNISRHSVYLNRALWPPEGIHHQQEPNLVLAPGGQLLYPERGLSSPQPSDPSGGPGQSHTPTVRVPAEGAGEG